MSLREVIGARGKAFRVSVPSLDVMPGDALAIVGPSGSGKSTILDMLAGILRPMGAAGFRFQAAEGHGDLFAFWQRGDGDGLRDYRARMIGYVMQTGGLVPFLSIADNVALPFWRDGSEKQSGVTTILRELGIDRLAQQMPKRVSVGERQRAAIARALVARPPLILADEPTAALDSDTADTVMALLTRAARQRSAALVLVTHDPDLAERHGLKRLVCRRAGPGLSKLDLH
ncbi:MAG: ABC transporter ATP-binding protein [Geminicoccaceae bacterium]